MTLVCPFLPEPPSPSGEYFKTITTDLEAFDRFMAEKTLSKITLQEKFPLLVPSMCICWC